MIITNIEVLRIIEKIDNNLIWIYIIECILKLIGLGINKYFSDTWNSFDFGLVLMTLITEFAFSIFKFFRNARSAKASRIMRSTKIHRTIKITKSVRSIKFLKIFKNVARPLYRLKKLLHKIILCLGAIKQTLTLLIMIFHFFAILGMELYDTRTQKYNYGSTYGMGISDFNSYLSANINLIMLITANGWSNMIYDYQYMFGQDGYVTIYISSFWSIVKLIILS